MSLILDALNKADRENRKPESSPSLETEHAQPIELPAKSSNLPWYFLVLLICMLSGAAIFFVINKSNFFGNRSQTIPTTPTHSIQVKNISPPVVSNSSQATNNTLNNVAPSQTKAISQTPNKAEELRQKFIQAQYAQQQTTNKNLTGQSATQLPKAQKEITGLYQQPTATAQKDISKAITPIATQKPKPQAPKKHTENTAKQVSTSDSQLGFYGHVGSVRDLPFNAQNNVPTMMYTEHNYTRKSVTINGKEYREKSSIAKGLVIEKVLEDGLILKYEQYTFKMRAYNNWINL